MDHITKEKDGIKVTTLKLEKETNMFERFNKLKETVWETADGNVEKIVDHLVFGILSRDNLIVAMSKGDPTEMILEAHKWTESEIEKAKEKK